MDDMHVEVVCAIRQRSQRSEKLTITRLVMYVHPNTAAMNAPFIVYDFGSVSPEGFKHGQVGVFAEIADTGHVSVSVDREEIEGGDVGGVPFHIGENEEVGRSTEDLGCLGSACKNIADPEDG